MLTAGETHRATSVSQKPQVGRAWPHRAQIPLLSNLPPPPPLGGAHSFPELRVNFPARKLETQVPELEVWNRLEASCMLLPSSGEEASPLHTPSIGFLLEKQPEFSPLCFQNLDLSGHLCQGPPCPGTRIVRGPSTSCVLSSHDPTSQSLHSKSTAESGLGSRMTHLPSPPRLVRTVQGAMMDLQSPRQLLWAPQGGW